MHRNLSYSRTGSDMGGTRPNGQNKRDISFVIDLPLKNVTNPIATSPCNRHEIGNIGDHHGCD